MSLPLSSFLRVRLSKTPGALQTQDQSLHVVVTDEYPDDTPVLIDNLIFNATGLADIENVWGSDAEVTKAATVAFAPDDAPNRMIVAYWNKSVKTLTALANSLEAVMTAKPLSALLTEYTFQIKSREFSKSFTLEISTPPADYDAFVLELNDAISGTEFVFSQVNGVFSLQDKTVQASQFSEGIELVGSLSDDLRLSLKYGAKEIRGRDATTLQPKTIDEVITAVSNITPNFFGFYIACDLTSDDDLELAHDKLLSLESRHVLAATIRKDYLIYDRNSTNPVYRIAAKNSGIFLATIAKNTNKHIGIGLLVLMGSTNWAGVRTAKTLKFKIIEGVSLDDGITSQVQIAANEIGLNYYAGYADNAMVFLANGRMCALEIIHGDSIAGRFALANQIESDLATTIAGAETKIAQTDEDQVILEESVQRACRQFMTNGFGGLNLRWGKKGFGKLRTGDILDAGFYIHSEPYYTQSQADREAGKAMPIQVAFKESGAVGEADVALIVER